MPKQTLTGSLEEQCEFLYNLAQEKMGQGNFTGAVHTFQEISKHLPHYREVDRLLAEAQRQKSAQSMLLIAAFVGAAVFVGVGTFLKLPNDFLFLLLAIIGAVVGFGVGNFAILPKLRS